MDGTHPQPSFIPFIRLIASYLAIELIFAGILKIKPMILAVKVLGFNYLRMKMVDFTF